ncbi:MAG: transcription-repair coupling factor [Deltaproteobacteria bacterium]|nr:transcription-repair coupling factor [Deltaproteobacteria bacterium]
MNVGEKNIQRIRSWIDQGRKHMEITGLSGTERVYFLSRLLVHVDRPCLLILPEARDLTRFAGELSFFLPESFSQSGPGGRRLREFPAYDISPLKGLSPQREIVTSRIEALYSLLSDENPIIVSTTEAALLRVLPKEAMIESVEYLDRGLEIDREDLIRRFETCGYLRTSLVEERGDYAVRGGVIDVFPPLYGNPVRLEFWGDRIESLRHFDPLSQRSTGSLERIILLPANEIIMGEENVRRARGMGRLPEQFADGGYFPGQEAWLNHFYSRPETLFDYLTEAGIVVMMDAPRVKRRIVAFSEQFGKDAERYRQEAIERERPFPEIEGLLLTHEEVREHLERYQDIDFTELPLKDSLPKDVLSFEGPFLLEDDLTLSLAGKGKMSMVPLVEKIHKWIEGGGRVVLVCRTEQQARRLKEILEDYQIQADQLVKRWEDLGRGRGLTICLGRLTKGFVWPEMGLYVVSEDEIFGPKRALSRARRVIGESSSALTAFSQLKLGDLVVHQDHGIGRYGGLCQLEIEGRAKDFVLIEYAQKDRLYIPADRISVLQKYIGEDDRDPNLDRLGGRSWDIARRRAKRAIEKIARQLVEIYALRKHRKGYAFTSPDSYYREFEATFEHEETRDQVKTIEEVLSDMESEKVMDRLICGDVGFGKTEVAIRAAFKAVMDGKQVALLVPTTVLAEQHHETFRKRMEPYRVRVGVLSRFKGRMEQKDIIAGVRSGEIDILIGTHRILQNDISFRDLGLLIVDEEQRFGVKQKERLKRYRALVDVLAMTATPIPRTFQMSLMGIRDLSIIETPPEDRLAIKTYLSHFDEATIVQAVEEELARGGQVFFVHNRVNTINEMADNLRKLLPGVRFGVAHGQMNEKDLEETMIRFIKRDLDVLVCTTIIESGLDIPSANTIIINEVDRLGLAQIYQLRGRVGRSKESAYAYLILSNGTELTRDAEKRLRALMDFSHLGAGIHLAMHDLRIRGGGNILGFSQSGHIAAIGYELYMKLIEQTVSELKGEEWQEETNPEINVEVSACLPESYISDTDLRLNLYRRMSALREERELRSMVEEMADRFGQLPGEVSNLIKVMEARLLLKRAGMSRLDIKDGALIFHFSPNTKVGAERIVKIAREEPKKVRMLSDRKLKIPAGHLDPTEALEVAKGIIREKFL